MELLKLKTISKIKISLGGLSNRIELPKERVNLKIDEVSNLKKKRDLKIWEKKNRT